MTTEKGKEKKQARQRKYRQSPNAKETQKRYYRSQRGIETRRRWERVYRRRPDVMKKRQAIAKRYLNKRTPILKKFVNDAKAVPCTDCKVQYPPYIMDFDHVRGVKRKNISTLVCAASSWETLLAELEKCDIVCSNCHREREYQRRWHRGGVKESCRPLGDVWRGPLV
jgi:hypothetical protein